MKQKFKIDYIVKYNGNIYQIVGLKMGKQSLIYDVKCLKNNFPDEPVSSSIGSCAEDKMELVDFNEPTEKQQRLMPRTKTFYFDNFDNCIELHRRDRTTANRLADNKGQALGAFIALLVNELDRLRNGEALSVTITKGL